MSARVREGQAQLFDNARLSDLTLRFHLERDPAQQAADKQPAKRAKLERAFLGAPLPAHQVIVCLGSRFISARLESWQAAVADQAGGSKDAAAARPEVHIPLGCEDELPHAREVVLFMYTGALSSGLGFKQLLTTRRLAGYLEVPDCVRACDEAMLVWVSAAGSSEGGAAGPSGGSTSGSTPAASRLARVVEAYRCHRSFPDPATAPDPDSFKRVRGALVAQLVPCLGDAVAVYADAGLLGLWKQLPQCAVEEVLSSDELGTDCEASVLVLVAAWLQVQHLSPDAWSSAARSLCARVRASRLGMTYIAFVLPEMSWFGATPTQLSLLQQLASTPPGQRARRSMLETMLAPRAWCAVPSKATPAAWAGLPPRRQITTPSTGRVVKWSVSAEQLKHTAAAGLDAADVVAYKDGWVSVFSLCESVHIQLHVKLEGPGVLPDGRSVLSHGLLWRLRVGVDRLGALSGPFGTSCYLKAVCELPPEVKAACGGHVDILVAPAMTLELHQQRGPEQQQPPPWRERIVKSFETASTSMSWGETIKLPVQLGRLPVGGDPLGPWAPYLKDGKLCGAVIFHQQQ